MRERMTTILFLILAYCSSGNVYGQKVNYQQFDNIYLGAEASVISCFLQVCYLQEGYNHQQLQG